MTSHTVSVATYTPPSFPPPSVVSSLSLNLPATARCSLVPGFGVAKFDNTWYQNGDGCPDGYSVYQKGNAQSTSFSCTYSMKIELTGGYFTYSYDCTNVITVTSTTTLRPSALSKRDPVATHYELLTSASPVGPKLSLATAAPIPVLVDNGRQMKQHSPAVTLAAIPFGNFFEGEKRDAPSGTSVCSNNEPKCEGGGCCNQHDYCIGGPGMTGTCCQNGPYCLQYDTWAPFTSSASWYVHIATSTTTVMQTVTPNVPPVVISTTTSPAGGQPKSAPLASTETATSSTSSSASPTPHPSSNTAAIGGGVGGGVAALAIAGLIVFFCRRRAATSRQSHGQDGFDAAQPERGIPSPTKQSQPIVAVAEAAPRDSVSKTHSYQAYRPSEQPYPPSPPMSQTYPAKRYTNVEHELGLPPALVPAPHQSRTASPPFMSQELEGSPTSTRQELPGHDIIPTPTRSPPIPSTYPLLSGSPQKAAELDSFSPFPPSSPHPHSPFHRDSHPSALPSPTLEPQSANTESARKSEQSPLLGAATPLHGSSAPGSPVVQGTSE
ncbi:hypothetical protein LTR66_006314 [Elasticomyces elasticus]|nr:hypothetical protein LTR66_006314 [Elasticomyces elasticus]